MPPSSHDDLSLRYVLDVPSGRQAETPSPLVLVMHGRGADAADLADIAPLIDPGGCRFVFPNAPHPFEPYPGMTFGFSWFDGWPPRGTTFGESRSLLLTFLEELDARYPTPAGALVIAGFSQGGMMALDIGFRTARKVAGIVCMSGALNENEPPPDGAPPLPLLVIHGTEDEMIPVSAARRTRLLLGERGLDPEYEELAMGHEVTSQSLALVASFLRSVLPAGVTA